MWHMHLVSIKMPLILQPKFSDLSREEIESHIEQVRARRMAAVVQYHAGVNAKLEFTSVKIQAKIAREYHLLSQDIEKADKLDEKIEQRLQTLEMHMQELGQTHDALIPMEDEDD